MNSAKKFITAAALALTLVVSAPAVVSAQPLTADSLGISQPGAVGLSNKDVRTTIATIVRTALGFLGTIAFLIFFYAGFLWMTAGGNTEKVEEAQKWMGGAVIGLAIILLSYGLTTFVITQLVGATSSAGTPGV